MKVIMVNKRPVKDVDLSNITGGVNQELLNSVKAEQNKTALLIQELLKVAETYEKNIMESSLQTDEQVEKTRKTVEALLELSEKIVDPANNVCADISSQSLHIIGEAIKNQQFFASQLVEKNQELARLKTEKLKLIHKAFYDELTGLGNRHLFKETFSKFKNDFAEKGQIFSMVMFDLDDFKKINDDYSHKAGDKVLSFFAEKIRSFFFEKLGEKGISLRLGGEEFGVIAQIPKSEMYILIEAFRKKCSKTYEFIKHKREGMPEEKYPIQITFSGGVVEYRTKLSANGIFDECSQKLKEAKRKGKNIIIK